MYVLSHDTRPLPSLQFLNWDTVSRRRIDLIGRKDRGDQVVVHEFDFSKTDQVVYDHKVHSATCSSMLEAPFSTCHCCYIAHSVVAGTAAKGWPLPDADSSWQFGRPTKPYW